MLAYSKGFEITLGPDRVLSLRRTAGWAILCKEGRVWLTEELGGEDVWLVAGQRILLSRRGRTVIEATAEGATLRMLPRAARLRLSHGSGYALRSQQMPRKVHCGAVWMRLTGWACALRCRRFVN